MYVFFKRAYRMADVIAITYKYINMCMSQSVKPIGTVFQKLNENAKRERVSRNGAVERKGRVARVFEVASDEKIKVEFSKLFA